MLPQQSQSMLSIHNICPWKNLLKSIHKAIQQKLTNEYENYKKEKRIIIKMIKEHKYIEMMGFPGQNGFECHQGFVVHLSTSHHSSKSNIK